VAAAPGERRGQREENDNRAEPGGPAFATAVACANTR
jgi:hypothetical protein